MPRPAQEATSRIPINKEIREKMQSILTSLYRYPIINGEETFETLWNRIPAGERVGYLRNYREYYGVNAIGQDPLFMLVPLLMQKYLVILTKYDTQSEAHLRHRRRASSGLVRSVPNSVSTAQREKLKAWIEKRLGYSLCPRCGEKKGSDKCDCKECPNCHKIHWHDIIFCRHCGRCEDCCECEICRACGELAERCECAAIYYPRRNGERQILKFHGEPSALFPRYVGVEIEFGGGGSEKAKIFNKAVRKWRAAPHSDGSIEDFDWTCEVATAPAQGDAFVEQITDICEGIKAMDGSVNSTCGLHVHVNAKDLDGEHLLNMIRLYSRVETALYSIVAPSRWRSSYASPWGNAFEFAQVLDQKSSAEDRCKRLDTLLYGHAEEVKRIKHEPYKHEIRYRGLNLNAMLLYGTIEFRMHQGTTNPEKILHWSAVCSAIVQYAATHTEKQIKALHGDSFEVLCKVVGHPETIKWMAKRRAWFASKQLAAVSLIERAAPGRDVEDSETALDVSEFRARRE